VIRFISVQRNEFDPDREIFDSEDEIYPSLSFAPDCEVALSTKEEK
jgi:hypothetical protein